MDTILKAENIWKTYGSSSVKVNALNGIDLSLQRTVLFCNWQERFREIHTAVCLKRAGEAHQRECIF